MAGPEGLGSSHEGWEKSTSAPLFAIYQLCSKGTLCETTKSTIFRLNYYYTLSFLCCCRYNVIRITSIKQSCEVFFSVSQDFEYCSTDRVFHFREASHRSRDDFMLFISLI